MTDLRYLEDGLARYTQFDLNELLFFVSLSVWIASVVTHVLFAAGVANDARKLRDAGGSTRIVSPAGWAIATFAGGVIVAGIYWLIHRSSFGRDTSSY